MPRGQKLRSAGKQKRQARHIEDSEKKRGMSTKRARSIAYATINKQSGGKSAARKSNHAQSNSSMHH